MVGTPEGGKKAYEATKDKYGLDQIKEWGSLGRRAVRNRRGGFNDPKVVKVASSNGGKNSARCRVIAKDSELRWDEWGVLTDIVYMMLESSTLHLKSDKERLDVYESFAYCMRQKDWQTIMSCWKDLGIEYDESFEYALKLRLQDARESSKGMDSKTPDRNEYRILRNLWAAYNVVKEEKILGEEI